MTSPAEDAARTETIFRAGNEALSRAAGERDRIAFICECGDQTCLTRVALTPETYEAVRSNARRFLVAPGHEEIDGEEVEVVERRETFSVVEKRAVAGEIAERMNPRGNRANGEAS